jgi:hypothetical protein
MRWALSFLCSVIVLARHASAADAPETPPDFRYSIRSATQGPVYPYQAVRVALALQYLGRNRWSPEIEAVPSGRLAITDSDGKTVFDSNSYTHVVGDGRGLFNGHSVGGAPRFSTKLELRRDEAAISSFATGFIRKSPPEGGDFQNTVLFAAPGKYVIRLYEKNVLDDFATIEIAAWDPADAHVGKQIAGDAELAEAMLSPILDVRDEMRPKLEEIVRARPKSTYANYARLAIARSYLYGDGFSKGAIPLSKRDEALAGEKEMVMHRLTRSIAEGSLQQRWFNQWSNFPRRRATTLPLLEQAYQALRADDQKTLANCVERLCAFDMPDEARRRAAQVWLDEITDPNFPYYPTAIAISFLNARIIDPIKSKAMETIMRDTAPGSWDSLCLIRLLRPRTDPRSVLVVKLPDDDFPL